MSTERDAYIKIGATVGAFVVTGAMSWVGTSLIDVRQDQKVVQTEVKELQLADTAVSKRMDFIVDKMMELHPMQRSSLAYFTADGVMSSMDCPYNAECRTDEDCGECFCNDNGRCE